MKWIYVVLEPQIQKDGDEQPMMQNFVCGEIMINLQVIVMPVCIQGDP